MAQIKFSLLLISIVAFTIILYYDIFFWDVKQYYQMKLNKAHVKSAVVCAIVKNEGLYVDEWVDYYLGLGFKMIYLYDNSEEFQMREWGAKKNQEWYEYEHRKVTKVLRSLGENQQTKVYDDCAVRARNEGHEWAAFFDVDEFLVLHKHHDIVTFLEEYCAVGALGINWRYFGTSGETEYRPLPITKRFTLGQKDVDRHIKSIARLADVDVYGHPHFVTQFKNNSFYTTDTNRKRIDGPFNPGGPSDIAVLHHYSTKSVSEYKLKRGRGRADIDCSNPSSAHICKDLRDEAANATLETLYRGELFDDSAWQTLMSNVPMYRKFENLGSKKRDLQKVDASEEGQTEKEASQ